MSAILIDRLMEKIYELRAENTALKARLAAIADAAAADADEATAWLAELRQKRTSVGALQGEASEVLLPSACLSAGVDQVETEF